MNIKLSNGTELTPVMVTGGQEVCTGAEPGHAVLCLCR